MEQQQKKHSACDECRARKLKCSGNSPGCERCYRDKVACVYSVQKPMGRPRKRRRGADPAGDEKIQYSPNMPAELSIVEVPHHNNHIVIPHFEHQSNAATGLFMGQYEWFNNEVFDQSSLSDLEAFSQASMFGVSGACLGPPQQRQNPPLTIRAREISPSSLRGTPVETYTLNDGVASYFPGLEERPVPTSCSCLASFFAAISTLRIPPPAHSISLPYVLQTSGAALQAAQNSFACESCHANVQVTYIINMLLGIQLPLLCQSYHRVLVSIETTTNPQYVVMGDGQAMQLDAELWKAMARTAIRKEAMKVLDIVRELEGVAAQIYDVPVSGVGNLTDNRGNESLCIRVLKTIKAVAEFIAMS